MHRPRGFGRARLRHVADCSAASLMPFVREAIEPGSTVCTGGWKAYDGLNDAGYTRYRQVLSSSPGPAHVSMPGVHRVASLLKRWLLGTHQGSVDPRHLQAYLDEFTLRFNRRNARQRGLLFYRLRGGRQQAAKDEAVDVAAVHTQAARRLGDRQLRVSAGHRFHVTPPGRRRPRAGRPARTTGAK